MKDGNDSSDSEGEAEVYTSDDEGELSFESDDEGNFSRNLNKLKLNGDDEEDEDDDVEDEGSSDEDDVYVSDSDDESSADNENDVNEEQPSVAPTTATTSAKQKKQKPTSVEAFKSELNGSSSKAKRPDEDDEYKNDSSDEEDIRNTIGNVPMQWYDEYKHIGYDWDAKKIIKPARRDQLDDFLKRMEDPNFWRTVKDMQTGQDIVISEADIELIKRINSQRIPDDQYDDYAVSSCVLFLGVLSWLKFQVV